MRGSENVSVSIIIVSARKSAGSEGVTANFLNARKGVWSVNGTERKTICLPKETLRRVMTATTMTDLHQTNCGQQS
jgi:hypothetical protein